MLWFLWGLVEFPAILLVTLILAVHKMLVAYKAA